MDKENKVKGSCTSQELELKYYSYNSKQFSAEHQNTGSPVDKDVASPVRAHCGVILEKISKEKGLKETKYKEQLALYLGFLPV